MITLALLIIISVVVLGLALFLLSVGGTVLCIFAADLIVAVGIVWLIVKLFRRKKK